MEPSSPAIHLPSISLPEVGGPLLAQRDEAENPLSGSSLEDLCHDWLPLEPFCWPYLDSLREKKLNDLKRRNTLLQYESHSFPTGSEIPNTRLNVRVYQPWSGFPSFLVDIKPWALFVNQSSSDLYFLGGSEWQQWHIHKGTTFTPPPIQGTFMVAVEQEGNFYPSSQLKFADEDESSSDNGVLRLGNDQAICVTIHVVIADIQKVFQLSVHTKMKDDMYIVLFRPHVNILNSTGELLWITGSYGKSSSQIPSVKRCTSHLVPASANGKPESLPILLWDLPDPSSLTTGDATYSLSICACDPSAVDPSLQEWSLPVPLKGREPSRSTVSICWGSRSKGLVITCHSRSGMLFVNIHLDHHPLLCIHNKTEFPLLYAEGPDASGTPVIEDSSVHLPMVPSGGVSFYTFPSVNKVFPASLPQMPTLCFARDSSDLQQQHNHDIWSQPMDITSEVDHFVHIPNAGDVRVHKERAGHTMHTFLESVNRVEVSAKEIRSRIAARTQPVDVKAKEVIRTVSKVSLVEQELPPRKDEPVLFLSVLFSHVCGVLCDEVTNPFQSEEVLRFSLDDAFIVVRPLEASKERLVSLSKQEVTVCVRNLQIDNQLAPASDTFDYKVLLIPQNKAPSQTQDSSKDFSTLSRLATHSDKAALTATLLVDLVQPDNRTILQKITLKTEPLAIYLEDSFYHHLIGMKKTFLVPLCSSCRTLVQPEPLVPIDLISESAVLASPLPLVQLDMLSLSMLVSLRASLKLYLSVDHSPLSFQPFQRHFLYTSSYGLGQLLTVHYVTGALLRAGWVVGSLDLLGNPSGLARALGSGLSDLVLLPYKGLFLGPWAFVSGISHGTASLLKQISSGAVISVTNLATSISRNMDRLSLDEEHCQRVEELRHSPPESLASGLKQGLTGFGISILGAIAGIVDHPLQAIVTSASPPPDGTPPSSTGSTIFKTASGIVGGASRGLVGMVVKPIGGAAELISQAGTGLLQGVGWRHHPQARYSPVTRLCSSSQSSQLKFSWKMMPGLVQGAASGPSGQVLMFLEASHIAQAGGHHVADVLFLCPHMLTIVNKEEDRQQQILALTEVDCCGCPDNPSVLYVTIRPRTPGVPIEVDRETTKRVAEYVHQVSSELGHLLSPSGRLEGSPNVSWRDAYQFYVFPKLRDYFVALFNIEQRKLLGKRFQL